MFQASGTGTLTPIAFAMCWGLAAVYFLTGCSQSAKIRPYEDDKYSVAASSWVGANIMEMVAAWPHPMPSCGSRKGGASGCVWWRHRGGSGTYAYECEAVAYYDEAGVITKVEVRKSDDCQRLFERHFERMTWP